MELGTIGGIIGGLGLFAWAVLSSTDNAGVFLDLASFLMVFGGAIAATMISFNLNYVMRAFKTIGSILVPSKVDAASLFGDVERMITWGKIVQLKGVPALEKEVSEEDLSDPFVAFGYSLLMTGYKPEEIREMLETATSTYFERNMVVTGIINTMGGFMPAFGMIGTLIGLVIMLGNMSGGPDALGAAMSIAMITTLYGVFFAQFIFKPASLKLGQKEGIQKFRNTLLTEAFVMLAEQKSAMAIQDALNSYLDPNFRFSTADD